MCNFFDSVWIKVIVQRSCIVELYLSISVSVFLSSFLQGNSIAASFILLPKAISKVKKNVLFLFTISFHRDLNYYSQHNFAFWKILWVKKVVWVLSATKITHTVKFRFQTKLDIHWYNPYFWSGMSPTFTWNMQL